MQISTIIHTLSRLHIIVRWLSDSSTIPDHIQSISQLFPSKKVNDAILYVRFPSKSMLHESLGDSQSSPISIVWVVICARVAHLYVAQADSTNITNHKNWRKQSLVSKASGKPIQENQHSWSLDHLPHQIQANGCWYYVNILISPSNGQDQPIKAVGRPMKT